MAKIEQGLARIEKFSKGLAKQVYCSWNAEKDPEAIKDRICRNEHIANPLKSFAVDGLWLRYVSRQEIEVGKIAPVES